MRKSSDAQELFRLVADIVRGGAPSPAGVFGPFGMDRGAREELLRQTGYISSKIASSALTEADIDRYFAFCQVCRATEVMAEEDLQNISRILERNV